MRKILNVFLLLSILVSVQASPVNETIKGNINTYFVDDCDLPAPENLVITNVTSTSMSFSWDPVSGADGYYFELTDVAANTVVQSGTEPSTSHTCTGLDPDKVYKFRVWSVCPNNNGSSSQFKEIEGRTDYVIIDDDIAGLQNYSVGPVVYNNYALFAGEEAEDPLYFMVTNDALSSTPVGEVFGVEKNFPGGPPGLFLYHAMVTCTNENKRWLFKYHDDTYPPECSEDKRGTFVKGTEWDDERVHLYFPRVEGNVMSMDWTAMANGWVVRPLIFTGERNKPDSNIESAAPSDELFKTSPNPFTDEIYLSTTTDGTVSLLDMQGKTLKTQTVTGENTSILSTADISAGIYFLRFQNTDQTKTIKVVKTN